MTRSHRIWKPFRVHSLLSLWSLWISALPGLSAEIQWIRDYREGMDLAKESNRPVLVDFWSEWCVPCKLMDSELYKDPRVIVASRRFVFIRVNADSHPEIASRFAVKSIPARLFMDPWGTVLLSVKGSTTADAFVETIKPIPDTFEPISESFMDLEQNPNDSEAFARIADFYRKAGFPSQADEFHARADKAGRDVKAPAAREGAQHEAAPPAVPSRAPLETIPSRLSQSLLRPGMEPSASPPPPPSPQPTPIVDLSGSELLTKYPGELLGVEFDSNQAELDSLLKNVGKRVEEFFGRLPNTLSKERIRQERLKENGSVESHVDQDVEYLLLLNVGATGLRWKEDRTDNKGKPIKLKRLRGYSFLTSGFALQCVVFYPSYQRTVRYRYLGRQSSPPYAHLIAFAQIPEQGGIPGVFQMPGTSVRTWHQGLAWVDPKTYLITRMRTDLLAPSPEAGLTRQTTEISYTEYQFSARNLSLLLPRQVLVTIEFENRVYRNIHRYSDYKLFTVESYEKHEPVLRPHVPE